MADKKTWDNRFMEMAKLVGSWSTCIRGNRKVGAVIVKDKRVLATGYNGAPSGIESCLEKGLCLREKMNIKSGTCQELCYAVHAEQNAVAQAAKLGHSVEGATIYITHSPCSVCSRILINAGIKKIVFEKSYPDEFSLKLLKESNTQLEQLKTEKD